MAMEVPPCTHCGVGDTASVQVGVVWITILMASTCPKFTLIPNEPKPGNWFYNSCQRFFDVLDGAAEKADTSSQPTGRLARLTSS